MVERRAWLLRHGETGSGAVFRGDIDDALTETGWRQMGLGARNAGKVEAVITSPLSRCRSFAESYGALHGLPVTVEADLREMHFGDWEGRSADDILRNDAATLEAFWRDPRTATPAGGEPFASFEARVLAAWRRIAARSEPNVLVVTHGGPIRVMIVHRRALPFHHLLELDVAHGSLHELPR